jgi:hypothetical protein
MAVIGLSLVSVVVAAFGGSMEHSIQWWGEFPGSPENNFGGIGFWTVFAVFFPASTGIMAGANMSGELKNPRRSIPVGTMSAIGVSLLIYLALAYWLARSASTSELVENYTVMIDKARWGPAVLGGLLGATFSSALSSLVGAPRILQALGAHDILPQGKWFATKTARGEPRNAMLLTGAIVLGALMLRDLNAIAPLITMFFLLTYAMINLVVLIEQWLKLVSFRPLLRIPRVIPILGALGCVFVMFIVNPAFGLAAAGVVLAIHAFLVRRHLRAPFGDVRSGLYVGLAEWAAKKVDQLAASRERTWKANVLVPVEDIDQARDLFPFIRDISYPKGFLKIVGLTGRRKTERELTTELPEITDEFTDEGVFASWTVITVAAFSENLQAGIETFAGTFFKPNVLLLRMPEDEERKNEVRHIIDICRENRIGILLLHQHASKGMGEHRSVNVWFAGRGPEWELTMDLGNQDLALLTGYKLKLNWKAGLRLIARIKDNEEKSAAYDFLQLVSETARIPNAACHAVTSDEEGEIPEADLHVFPLPEEVDFDLLAAYVDRFRASCAFTLDSGEENALV